MFFTLLSQMQNNIILQIIFPVYTLRQISLEVFVNSEKIINDSIVNLINILWYIEFLFSDKLVRKICFLVIS